MEVWCRRGKAERGPEYKPLPAGSGGRDPGPERQPDPHPIQELPSHLSTAGLPWERQQDSHGGPG